MKTKVIVTIILLFGMLFFTTACSGEPDRKYETLSADAQILVDYIISSGVLHSANSVGLIESEGQEYLVAYTVESSSQNGFILGHRFYPVYDTEIGSEVTGTEVTWLEGKLIGAFKGLSWDNSFGLQEKREILATIISAS